MGPPPKDPFTSSPLGAPSCSALYFLLPLVLPSDTSVVKIENAPQHALGYEVLPPHRLQVTLGGLAVTYMVDSCLSSCLGENRVLVLTKES